MPDCNKTLRDLQLFLDGELTGEEYQHVIGHLDECLECLHTFDFQAELKLVIARKCRTEAMPPGLLERIEECFLPDVTGTDATDPV